MILTYKTCFNEENFGRFYFMPCRILNGEVDPLFRLEDCPTPWGFETAEEAIMAGANRLEEIENEGVEEEYEDEEEPSIGSLEENYYPSVSWREDFHSDG